jgi:DNA-binding LacI/PurR family transcriptional regulator
VGSATLVDVALRAGVSRTTASNALSGRGRVSPATRAAVLAAAAELDFVPNRTAQLLRTGAEGAIGIYMPEEVTRYEFHMDFTFGAAERAGESGLNLTIVTVAAGGPHARPLRIDGLLAIETMLDDPVLPRLDDGRLPIVHVGKQPGIAGTPRGLIRIDHRQAMIELLDHLHQRGARRIGVLVTYPDFTSDWSTEVQRAHGDWCAERGLEALTRPIAGPLAQREIEDAVTDLVRADHADAIIGMHSASAAMALRALQSLGVVVGVDVLLASGAAVRSDALARPPITAIELNGRDFGRNAAQLLIEVLDGPADAEPVQRAQPYAISYRESTLGPDTADGR